jgi:hypothetical protein
MGNRIGWTTNPIGERIPDPSLDSGKHFIEVEFARIPSANRNSGDIHDDGRQGILCRLPDVPEGRCDLAGTSRSLA